MTKHRHCWQYLGVLTTGLYSLVDWCPCGTLRLELSDPGRRARWHYRRPAGPLIKGVQVTPMPDLDGLKGFDAAAWLKRTANWNKGR